MSSINPPNIGAESLFITSAPSPTESITGKSPIKSVTRSITMDRKLLRAPSEVASKQSV